MTQKTEYNVTTEEENQEKDVKNTELEEEVKSVQEQVENTAYPDINKADTKKIVIVSLIVVIIIFLLSIFLPANASATEQASDVENASVTEGISVATLDEADTDNVRFSFMDTLIAFEPESGFATKGQDVFYYGNDTTAYIGWLELDENTYYFDENGVMAKGWTEIDSGQYYFDENGILQKKRWIVKNVTADKDVALTKLQTTEENTDEEIVISGSQTTEENTDEEIVTSSLRVEKRESDTNDLRVYVDSTGCMLTNTIAPGGVYVGSDGYPDTSAASLATSQEGLTDLKNELTEMISGYTGTWSVYVKSMACNEYLEINNVQHYSASLIKLYCGATIYDLIEKGELEETEYIDRLMAEMISVSDNDAFNLLVMQCDTESRSHVTGRGVIQNYIDENGYKDTTITSILVPSKYTAPSSAGRNYTTVVDCGLLLENIYKRLCVSREASEKFLKLLLNQEHINKIPSGLPEGVVCANKTGDTDEVQHDAAIVYAPNGVYIISVMSTGCGNAINNIQSISSVVYDYFAEQ
jgi:predicted RNA-binding protein with PUA-like domain